MNGILSGMPMGVLDPRAAAMATMGANLMAASGPSRTPVSFGQALGQAVPQGLGVFQQMQQAQLQEEIRKRQMAMQEEELRLRQQRANQPPAPLVASPGAQLFRPGESQPYHTVPFKPEAPDQQRPMTRSYQVGDQTVTEEFVDGSWRELGRGPKFQPVKPPAPPKPPKDYEWTDDTYTQVRPVKGGPKDQGPKEDARAAGAVQKADTVIRKVDEALGQVGFTSTGMTGTVMGMVPGTQAYDLDKTIDTIKANLGFSELQAMREASPTGGALGQVAIQELAMLQSTVASLDKGQSEENLRRALVQVRKHFENWKAAVQQSQQGGAPAAPVATPQAPAVKRKVYDPKTGTFK